MVNAVQRYLQNHKTHEIPHSESNTHEHWPTVSCVEALVRNPVHAGTDKVLQRPGRGSSSRGGLALSNPSTNGLFRVGVTPRRPEAGCCVACELARLHATT